MPMLTTVRMRRPVCPVHSPERIASEKRAIRSSTAWTAGTTFSPSTWIAASAGARSATCSTARSSVMLMCSPENIASIRPRRPRSSARRDQQPQRLVRDPVLGVVEEEPLRLGRHARSALRIVREQVAQMLSAELLGVLLERLVRRAVAKRAGAGGPAHDVSSCGAGRRPEDKSRRPPWVA